MVYAEFSTLNGACGVGIVSCFTTDSHYRKEITLGTPGGIGLLTAGFIVGNEICDKAYALLSEKYKVEYISPTRLNVNSGNRFYFVVFDCAGTDVPCGFDEFNSENDDALSML